MRKVVSFSGYYGMSNYGDDLFAITCALGAEKYWGVQPAVIAPPICGIEEFCTVPRSFRSEYLKVDTSGALVRAFYKGSAVLKSNMLVLGGGSTVSPLPPKIFDFYSRFPLFKSRLAGIGLSVEPVVASKEVEENLARFLKEFKFISLRDRASYEYVSGLGVSCPKIMARDLVGALPGLLQIGPKEANEKTVIGVAPCNYESYVGGSKDKEKDRNLGVIEGVINFARQKTAAVLLFSMNNHPLVGDDDLVLQYEKKLHDAGIECLIVSNAEVGPIGVWNKIRSCNYFVSVRLHGAITAYLNEVPFLLVEYHKKCTEFLVDIGMPDAHRLDAVTAVTVCEKLNQLERIRGQQCSLSAKQYEMDSLGNFVAFREYVQ